MITLAGINLATTTSIERTDQQILDGRFEEKQLEMDILTTVRANFSAYKYAVMLSHTMFDFLPRGDLPQIMNQLHAGVTAVNENPDVENTFFAFHDIKWTGYDLSIKIYCGDEVFPSEYTAALNEIGFFENIIYQGFNTIEVNEQDLDELIYIALSDNSAVGDEVVEFELHLRLKGGHIYEEDGSKFGQTAPNPDSGDEE
jgi:hypothetical protein